MKRTQIILLAGLVAVLLAGSFGVTQSSFIDQETSTDNALVIATSWIQIDAVSTGTDDDVTQLTVPHNTGSGNNRLMLISTYAKGGTLYNVSSVTYNGQPAQYVGRDSNGGNGIITEIWKLVAPTSGTYNVVVTWAGEHNYGCVVGVITFTGVNQTTPLGTAVTANGDSQLATVNVSSSTDELVFDATGQDNKDVTSDMTPGANQTQQWQVLSPSYAKGAASTEAGAATVTMSWSWTTDTEWAIVAVPVKPAP
ncbi:MAG: hypothetical protein A2Z29_10745 [Chloroflexi bacterium RBG_16_56_11]|nr:MAG: hypothetical protein A2Z29_10745 [Chloroflexi bacterium RBG_16_56_11]